jgi:hypothetical protein
MELNTITVTEPAITTVTITEPTHLTLTTVTITEPTEAETNNGTRKSTISTRASEAAKVMSSIPALAVIGSVSCSVFAIGMAISATLLPPVLLIHTPVYVLTGNTAVYDTYCNIPKLSFDLFDAGLEVLDQCTIRVYYI